MKFSLGHGKIISPGRAAALLANRRKREKYLKDIADRVHYLSSVSRHKDVAKIILVMLYLCEGSKRKGSLMFGNSNPAIIRLFLSTLRQCYAIDESKFRITLQCRADQNINALERYWSEITGVPSEQFYASRIDPRSIGKASRKPDYKGICRVDYFSAHIYNEITIIGALLTGR